MLRNLLICFLLLGVAGILNAQESLLWRITSPDGKINSYVLCSTELPGVENYDISTPVNAVMNKVNTVAIFNVPDAAETQNIPVFMKSPGENTLKGYYKREDRIRFELMVADKLKANVEDYYTTKPLYILQQFRDKDHAAGLNFQQTIILDMALQSSKPTLSLLTIRQISGTMDEMDFATQASVLSNYVNNAAAFIDADTKKFTAYSKQSLTDYAATLYTTEMPAYTSIMINSINDLLMRKIEPLSTQQSVLYVLNTDLVCGDNGILKKLKNKGFTVAAETFNLKKVAADLPVTNNNQPQENKSTPSSFPDDFPTINILPSTSGYLNPDEIKLVNVKDMSADGKHYIAYDDPFGDQFDMAGADTLFLDYWTDLKGEDANFDVRVPIKGDWDITETPWGNEGTIKKYIYQTNHAKSDLFYSVGYTIYPPSFLQTNKNSFFDQFLTQTRDQLNGRILKERVISAPGYTGREFTAVVGDSFFVRSVFILQENVFYQLLVGGPGNNPYSAYAEAFLGSFRLGASTLSNWYTFDQASYSCILPTAPSKSAKTYTLPEGPMTVTTFASDDYKELVVYSVSVSAYPPGHKFGNTNGFFDDLVANAERQYIGKAYKNEKVKKNGVEGRYVEMQLMNNKTYRMYFFFDGNSVYQFVAGGDAGVLLSLNVNRFFNSIHFSGNN